MKGLLIETKHAVENITSWKLKSSREILWIMAWVRSIFMRLKQIRKVRNIIALEIRV